MREIKFRGHDGCDWIYAKSIDYCELDDNHYMLTGDICDGEDAWTGVCYVGQYTGLKDKNGKEIYEGDIVRLPEDEDYKYYSIIYSKNRLGFTLSNGCGFGLSYGIEVVGNIYENPELLEVKND